jgi:nifR3 family TIM-barrel protein
MSFKPFSKTLQNKIDPLMARRPKVKLGSIDFDSPLLLAPMSAICNAPFRELMERLGAGGTVSELISCHGINNGNERTRNMLKIFEAEKNIGIQLFGEEGEAMAEASKVAQEGGPKFIDINMGCPVRKVVSKGGGSALLKEPLKLGKFFNTIKSALEVPLTIKIRTGWDENSINALEVMHIAKEEGVEFIAVHGRTRTQGYSGQAKWNLLEELASEKILPFIGNGDLHHPVTTKQRLEMTNCQALMLGRGPLRSPFIFLESYLDDPTTSPFTTSDYLEIINEYYRLLQHYTDWERVYLIQMRKLIVWFISGFHGASKLRTKLFEAKDVEDVMKLTEDYLLALPSARKNIDFTQSFMSGGHG